jgi:hypothetical protein
MRTYILTKTLPVLDYVLSSKAVQRISQANSLGGRQLQIIKTMNEMTKISTQNLIQGAYLINVKTDTDETAIAKVIKK